jgi:hypothetical protein
MDVVMDPADQQAMLERRFVRVLANRGFVMLNRLQPLTLLFQFEPQPERLGCRRLPNGSLQRGRLIAAGGGDVKGRNPSGKK